SEHPRHGGRRRRVERIEHAEPRERLPQGEEQGHCQGAAHAAMTEPAPHIAESTAAGSPERSFHRLRSSEPNAGCRRASSRSRGREIGTSWRARIAALGPCDSTYTVSEALIASSRSWVTSSTVR